MEFNFSEFIKMELTKKNMKSIDLAHAVGKTPAYISKILKNNTVPDYRDLKIIANKLDINYPFLLYQLGILDEGDIKHIVACDSLRGYLGELFKVNNMNESKIEAFAAFIQENNEKLEEGLTDNLINEVKRALGGEFIYPDYINPYTENSYYGLKKIKNLKLATGELVRSSFRNLPVYINFNDDESGEIVNEMGFDLSLIKEDIATENNLVWYNPEESEYRYVIEKGHYNSGDKVLYKSNGKMYTGKYNYQNKTTVITNIANALTKEEEETPVIFSEDNASQKLSILGKVHFEFKAG